MFDTRLLGMNSLLPQTMDSETNEHPLHTDQRILATLLNDLPGMAYRRRPGREWIMEFVSQGCLELTGFLSNDFVHNRLISYDELMNPLDREVIWREIEAALNVKKPYDLVYRIHTQSGAEKWVRELGRGIFNPDGSLQALEGFISDITDRKESEKRIQRQVMRFDALRKIDIAITASLDQRITFEILLDQVTTHLGVDAADMLLFNPSTRQLEYATGRGFHTSALQHTRLHLGESYAGRAAMERRTIHIANLPESLGELNRAPLFLKEGIVVYICVPLIAKGQVKGILEVFHRSPLEPDAEWLDFLEAVSGQAAIAIDNASMYNDLQRSNMELSLAYDATLEGWASAIELRDKDTLGHLRQSADLTVQLAQAMQIPTTETLHIRRGALLHDIGKMAIPDSILNKNGPLNDEEWLEMRKHPVYAYQMLYPITYLRPALDIPYCHHEKWDGTGYPRGLKAGEIPLPARIFAVADVWDALNSDRPYRSRWPGEKVLTYMAEQSGKHFDPQVMSVFLKLMEEKGGPKGYEH